METLKQVRKRKGVTKTAIANYLSVTPKTYATYEEHPGRMRVDVAMKVADFLGVPIGEIFFGWD